MIKATAAPPTRNDTLRSARHELTRPQKTPPRLSSNSLGVITCSHRLASVATIPRESFANIRTQHCDELGHLHCVVVVDRTHPGESSNVSVVVVVVDMSVGVNALLLPKTRATQKVKRRADFIILIVQKKEVKKTREEKQFLGEQ